MKLPYRFLLTTTVATLALAACTNTKKTQPPPPAPSETQAMTHETESGKYTVGSLDTDACLRQRVIYFDLDKTDIHSEFQAAISCHAAYLRQFPGARVTLEGNADERGTREYNLGL